MPNRLRVMADAPLPDVVLNALQAKVDIVDWTLPSRPDPSIAAIYTYSHPIVDADVLDRFPGLRGISNHGVGLDHIDLEACEQRGLKVYNTPGVLDGAVADAAFAIMLSAARRVVRSVRVAAHPDTTKFDQTQGHGQEVHDATLGIVGFGRIGQQIARRASGFDMTVLYHQRNRNVEAESRLGARYCGLDELLAAADFVILIVPLTDETTNLIAARQLALMKPSSILVNIARGPVVNTVDLLDALREKRIWGAALDVTDPEPLPRDHPLLKMENCQITAHLGSATIQTRKKMVDLSLQNLFRLID